MQARPSEINLIDVMQFLASNVIPASFSTEETREASIIANGMRVNKFLRTRNQSIKIFRVHKANERSVVEANKWEVNILDKDSCWELFMLIWFHVVNREP